MNFIVRLKGIQEKYISNFIKKGYFSNKNEVVRAGILELAYKYKIDPEPDIDEVLLVNKAISSETNLIKKGVTKTISEKQFLKKYPYLK
jgi:Arc/MetJ-type ribon-helix-helix transcriptional regulator